MIHYARILADYLVSLPFPALLVLKSSVVIVIGAVIAIALHRAAASMRYAVWALALAAIVALPVGMFAGPSWPVRITEAPAVVNNPSIDLTDQLPTSSVVTTVTMPAYPAATSIDLTSEQKLLIIWLIGSSLLIVRMIVARVSLGRLTSRSRVLDDHEWKSMLERESLRLGLERRVQLFASDRVSTPLAAGVMNAFIILPAGSQEWNVDHREIVLRHELSHIARGDAFICLLSGLACAIYWFNPLVWLASRRLRSEQERACDDAVITLGTPPTEYAAHLLEVARSARETGMSSFVSVAMARPSQLEGRLLAVLNDHRRNALTRTHGAGAVMVALFLVLTISALRPMRAESAIIVSSMTPPVVVTAVAPIENAVAYARDSSVSGDVKVESGGTLVLDLKTGAGVTIRGSSENRVRVMGRLSGRDWRATSFNLNSNDRDAFVKMDYLERTRSQSSSHHLDITVPRRFNVRINSAGGEISIRDVEGTFTGNTGGGEITIENARGSARLTTGGGEITVQNSSLSGSVSTGGGSVLIQNVTGGLSGSSGTGDVLYGGSNSREKGSPIGDVGDGAGRGAGSGAGQGVTFSEASTDGIRTSSDGKYYIRKSGGSVQIANAPHGASIITGGGSINIGATNGDLYAQTGGGDVSVAAADGAVEITTGAGDVEITVSGSDAHPIKINSGNGKVTLILPRGISADLDLETGYTNNHRRTRIESDWSISTEETTNWDARQGTPRRYVRAQQSIGNGGPRIRVKTTNGDIILKRR